MEPKEVGKRIELIRRSLGHSQKEFCQTIDFHQATVSKVEAGKRLPSIEMLSAMAEHFKISSNWVLFGLGTPYLAPGGDGSPTPDNIKIVMDRLDKIQGLLDR